MNTSLELRMKRHVERIVRPVRARWQRKLRMREDIHAHLMAAYQEEAPRWANEEDAYRAATVRLGEPAALTADLQASVPRLDRMVGALQFGGGTKESPVRIAFRVWAATLALTLVGFIATSLIANWMKPDSPRLQAGVGLLSVIALWTSTWAASLVALMLHVGRSAVLEHWDRRGSACWIMALIALPFLPPLWTFWATTLWDTPWMWGAALCAVIGLGIAFNAGWLLGKELKQRHPWEGLELSGA